MVTTHVPKNPLLKGVRQNFRRFLRSIAVTAGKAPEGRQRRDRQKLMTELRRGNAGQPVPSPVREDGAARRRMRDCMKRLPAEQQALLVMVCVQGRSYEESAGVLNIPVTALRDRLTGARQRLQELETAWAAGSFAAPARFSGANEGS